MIFKRYRASADYTGTSLGLDHVSVGHDQWTITFRLIMSNSDLGEIKKNGRLWSPSHHFDKSVLKLLTVSLLTTHYSKWKMSTWIINDLSY